MTFKYLLQHFNRNYEDKYSIIDFLFEKFICQKNVIKKNYLYYISKMLTETRSLMKSKYKIMSRTDIKWSNREAQTLLKYKDRLFQAQEQMIVNKIYQKEDNQMSFYQITPKQDLPKNMQKTSYQTLNSKQNIQAAIKVHKKQSLSKKQFKIRKLMKQKGQIMLLSEIYNYLDDPLENPKKEQQNFQKQVASLSNVINQLDQWEKVTAKKGTLEARFSMIRIRNSSTQERNSTSHKKQFIVKKFKIGSNYKSEVQKSLQVISCSHKNEINPMIRYNLIENSSKLLKKELQQMKQIVQKEIQQKMKKLTESRKQHHRLYQQKLKLQIQQQQLDQQMAKQEGSGLNNNGFSYHSLNQNNIKSVFQQKKNQIEKNQVKITKIRKNIQFLQDQTLKNEQQLKNIIVAQNTYYKISLKNGIDCRDSGLVWVIKKLGLQQNEISNYQFPKYLDKRSKYYLVIKARKEQQLQILLRQKRNFVKEIGKDNSDQFGKKKQFRSSSRKSSIRCLSRIDQFDSIKQNLSIQCDTDIPKRYSRSAKKITALRQQFLKNQNLFKLTQCRGGLKLGYNLNGLTGRQIYKVIGQKIKNVRQIDFNKLKREKGQEKNDKIFQYQGILRKIQDLHMEIQEQDIQHQSHLLSQYRDDKQLFFILAAACFGVKRAYSLIIKNFSWKNTS